METTLKFLAFVFALLLAGCATNSAIDDQGEAVKSTEKPQIAHGSKRSFHYTVETTASPDRIWQLWMAVDRWNEWDRGLKKATASDALATGVSGIITPLSGPASDFIVTEFEQGHSYIFETKLPLGRLVVERRLVAVNEYRTEFRHDVRFRGTLGWFWAATLGGDFMEALPPTMHDLAALAESRDGGR